MNPPTDLQDLEAALEAEGDEGELHARLLLWYMRKVMQVQDYNEYEYVFDADAGGIDGFWVESAPEGQFPVLHIFECKTQAPPGDAEAFAALERFRETVDNFDYVGFATAPSPEARGAALAQGVREIPLSNHFELRPTLLLLYDAPDHLLQRAETRTSGSTISRGSPGLPEPFEDQVFSWLPSVSHAVLIGASLVKPDSGVSLCARSAPRSLLLGPESRTDALGLNVRGELRQNRVRTGLDTAIDTQTDHPNFIAYHNGLTVLCREFDATHPNHVLITDLSVVNGAQSLLAFHRHREALQGTDLRVLVKFVTYPADHPDFATEVARRSNTQTAVNPRNLRANDLRQLALLEEFRSEFPSIGYLTKPEATLIPAGETSQRQRCAVDSCILSGLAMGRCEAHGAFS